MTDRADNIFCQVAKAGLALCPSGYHPSRTGSHLLNNSHVDDCFEELIHKLHRKTKYDDVKLPVRKHRAGLWTKLLAVIIFIESVDRRDMNAFVVKTMHRLGLLPGDISIAGGVVRMAFQRGRVGTVFVPIGCPET